MVPTVLGARGNAPLAGCGELAAERALVRQGRAARRADADVRRDAIRREAALGKGVPVERRVEVEAHGIWIRGQPARAPQGCRRGVTLPPDDRDRYRLAERARDGVREGRRELTPLAVFARERAQPAHGDIAPLVVLRERGERQERVRGEGVLLERPLAPREPSRLAARGGVEEAAATGVVELCAHALRV